jgi:S-adenosylmethionine:tRNA ribosyltransferase-isomerase
MGKFTQSTSSYLVVQPGKFTNCVFDRVQSVQPMADQNLSSSNLTAKLDGRSPVTAAPDDLLLSAYDYHLPPERIAQNPVVPRDSSQLLVVAPQQQYHCHFRDLPNFLRSGDLLVLNNTQVIPARLYGRTAGGAKVEVLLLEEKEHHRWLALVKPGRRLKVGAHVQFEPHSSHSLSLPPLTATVVDRDEATGGRILHFDLPEEKFLLQVLPAFGHVPLPPYITDSHANPDQYQTVYGHVSGSVAAPTAGLHFTSELLDQLQAKGIQRGFVTLHVGVGTFRPVEAEHITQHDMHGEWIEVLPDVVRQIEQTKARGGRVIAVGTTVTRTLEGAAQGGVLQPYCGKTNLFIYPGYRWQVIDGLITNFHLPKSSLMMLVSAMIGRQRLLDLYQEAIAHHYRFYSFGDAMFILPEE